jgi:hypothetical protein
MCLTKGTSGAGGEQVVKGQWCPVITRIMNRNTVLRKVTIDHVSMRHATPSYFTAYELPYFCWNKRSAYYSAVTYRYVGFLYELLEEFPPGERGRMAIAIAVVII